MIGKNVKKVNMNVIDKFLKQYSYKFDKGYPDMDNPKDKNLLEHLLKQIISEDEIEDIKVDISTKEKIKVDSPTRGGSKLYDDTIKYALAKDKNDWKNTSIPEVTGKYPFTGNFGRSFEVKVNSQDMPVWKALYPVKPPKVGKEIGTPGSLAVGNGEIALYWLYNYSNNGVNVEEGREGDNPDLRFNNVGVEVKAYDKPKGLVTVGRYGEDKETLALLSIIFGINALSNILGDEPPKKTVNPTNFDGAGLKDAMQKFIEFRNLEGLDNLAKQYPVFKSIQANIQSLTSKVGNFDDAETGARLVAIRLLDAKLGRKPGDGGFLANVLDNGDLIFFQIGLKALEDNTELLSNFKVSQSAIKTYFSKIFGS
tara:strand:- start:496 stop:1599 length:1104 start_codon:yes stop_codon:yes gene_type:complete